MSLDPPEKKLLKDWFDHQAASQLAVQISRVTTSDLFSPEAFIATATAGLSALEFQARVQQFADALKLHLPADIPTTLDILTRSLPPALDSSENVTNDGWIQWPIGHFIARYALDHPCAAFSAMHELTMRFSAEFAIRPFLRQDQDDILARLLNLTSHPNLHIRRWCSEGCRPRLPWGGHLKNLIKDPTPLLPILDCLIDDPELYVRKSVANNLNDIAKDHPKLVIDQCTLWLKNKTPGRSWIIRHALRTLLKDGHPDALALLGYHVPQKIQAALSSHPSSLRIGDSIQLSASLMNTTDIEQVLMVDFIVHYPRKKGHTSAKVFKWKSLSLPAKQQLNIAKSIAFKQTSIRQLYPGTHRIDLQINGHILSSTAVDIA